jgi:hypothetical protein
MNHTLFFERDINKTTQIPSLVEERIIMYLRDSVHGTAFYPNKVL